MPLAMYWNQDDEQKRKQRLEESLRLKKEARRGELIKETSMIDATISQDLVSKIDIDKQTELINNQQSEIRDLKHLLVQQNKVLEKILENQNKKYEVVYKTEKSIPEFSNEILPSLNENIGADIIDKTGIEISGGVLGKNQTADESISDKVKRLKAIRNKERI